MGLTCDKEFFRESAAVEGGDLFLQDDNEDPANCSGEYKILHANTAKRHHRHGITP